jgi:hypothetical protein
MNIFLLVANTLLLMAFIAHTFVGDGELTLNKPSNTDMDVQKREKWIMGRCGWHIVSVDLLFATILLGLINFTNMFAGQASMLLRLLSVYFLGYAVAWLITIVISKPFPQRFLKLGQWLLLLVLSGLLYYGS